MPDPSAPLETKIALLKEYISNFRYLAAHALLADIEKDLEDSNRSADEIASVRHR